MSEETQSTATESAGETTLATQDQGAGSASGTEQTEETSLLGSDESQETGKDGEKSDDAKTGESTKEGDSKDGQNKDGTKTEDKTGEKKDEAANSVPEKYDIKFPEGITVDQKALDKFSPVFKELGITQAGAQKLADVQTAIMTEALAAQEKSLADSHGVRVKEWKDETIKELGADHAKEMAYAAKFMNQFGTPELRKMLNMTGFGNHKEVVKAFIKAGKSISQDTLVDGPQKQSLQTEQQKAEVLYPSMKK